MSPMSQTEDPAPSPASAGEPSPMNVDSDPMEASPTPQESPGVVISQDAMKVLNAPRTIRRKLLEHLIASGSAKTAAEIGQGIGDSRHSVTRNLHKLADHRFVAVDEAAPRSGNERPYRALVSASDIARADAAEIGRAHV